MLPRPYFGPKSVIRYLHLLRYSNVLQTIFFMNANTLYPDQTAPKGSV